MCYSIMHFFVIFALNERRYGRKTEREREGKRER